MNLINQSECLLLSFDLTLSDLIIETNTQRNYE